MSASFSRPFTSPSFSLSLSFSFSFSWRVCDGFLFVLFHCSFIFTWLWFRSSIKGSWIAFSLCLVPSQKGALCSPRLSFLCYIYATVSFAFLCFSISCYLGFYHASKCRRSCEVANSYVLLLQWPVLFFSAVDVGSDNLLPYFTDVHTMNWISELKLIKTKFAFSALYAWIVSCLVLLVCILFCFVLFLFCFVFVGLIISFCVLFLVCFGLFVLFDSCFCLSFDL